jgi:hypothetical protein
MMCNFQNFTLSVSTIEVHIKKMTYDFSPLQRQGGGAKPWRSGGEAAGVELTNVGHKRSGGSGRRALAEEDRRGQRPDGHRRRDAPAGRRRTGTDGGRAAVQAGGRVLLKGANGGGPRQ